MEKQNYQLQLYWSEEPDWLSSLPAGINIPVLSTDPTKVHLSHFLWHKGHFHPLPAPKKLQPCSSKSRLKWFHSPHLKCCVFNQKFLKLQGSIQLRMFLFISWITAGSRGGSKGHLFGEEEGCRLPRKKLHGLEEVKGWIPLQKKSLQTGQGCLGQKRIPAGLVQGSFTNDSQAWEWLEASPNSSPFKAEQYPELYTLQFEHFSSLHPSSCLEKAPKNQDYTTLRKNF